MAASCNIFGENIYNCFYYLLFIILGTERLLLLLGEKPTSPSPSEGAACERVQQKAAVTLARLSRDPDVAQTAIQLKGAATSSFLIIQYIVFVHSI